MRSVGAGLLFGGLLALGAAGATGRPAGGPGIGIEGDERAAVVHTAEGFVRVEFVRRDIVRITASRSGTFPTDTNHPEFNGPYYIADYGHGPVALRSASSGSSRRLVPAAEARCCVEVGADPFSLQVVRIGADGSPAGADAVLLELSPHGGLRLSRGRAAVSFLTRADEHFIGWGADRHPLDLRGQATAFATSELGQEGEGGGFPVPWVMSSRGYGLFLNNVDPTTRMDVGRAHPGELLIDAADGGREGWNLDLYVVVGDSFADLMRGYTALTGKPILAEKWFFGNMQSKCCDWRASDVIYIASRFRELGLPLDAMILDLQWRENRPDMWSWTPAFEAEVHPGKANNLEWSPRMGDVPGMFRALDDLGVKLGLHENSTSTYSDDANGAGPYLAQALPDTSDPKVAARLWRMHRRRIADGADFWWQDQGERISAMGANGYPMKNLNGALWAKIVVEGMLRENHVSVPVFARSGPVGGHRYIAPWPGDVPAGLPYLAFDLDYIRNGGLAGFATIGADLGGFYHGATPDAENEIRRMADMLLVFPVIRTHGAYYKLPWMFAPKSQPVYTHYLLLRYRLLPYLYSAAIEAHETGRPILAPLCFDYGDDKATYGRDFDFLLGRDLLVAPVMTSAETREVYLPAGRWRNFWNDQDYTGKSRVVVNAPLAGDESLPFFVREGAVLPMIDPAANIPSALFDRYTFHLYPAPGKEVQHRFLDRAHALDESSAIEVAMKDGSDHIEVTFSGINHLTAFYLHGIQKPSAVVVDGVPLEEIGAGARDAGWTYGPSDFPLQSSTVVLKVLWPQADSPGGRTVSCIIRK